VTNDQSSLETSFCLLNFLDPLFAPEVLVREESVTDLVVLLDGLLVVALLGELWGELFHGYRDAVEQVAGPGDRAGDGGQVADYWGRRLELLVLFLDSRNLDLVV